MRTLAVLFVAAWALPLFAAEHGPICQWHRDPTTTMAVTWIQSGTLKGTSGNWESGKAGFGYGDGDDKTVFDQMRGNYRSVYIRSAYEIPAKVPAGAELVLELRYDDAFIAYRDGKEVARQGVEGAGNTVQKVSGHEAEKWERFPLGKAVAGAKGVLALEGHNTALNSSDFTLDPRVVARVKGGKAIPVIPEGAEWNYLAGAIPEKDWTSKVSAPKKGPGEKLVVCRFEYRAGGVAEWTEAKVNSTPFGPTSHLVQGVDLEGLTPATRYQFRIERRGEHLGPWEFETAPATFRNGLSFVTGGDMFHTRDLLDAMNARAGAEDPLFALLGGDLAYANGVNGGRWFEWVDSWREKAVAPDGRLVPMVVVIGNHEVKGAGFRPVDAPGRESAPFYYSLFRGQEDGGRFALTFGDYLAIVGLDSGHTERIATQTKWLDHTLGQHAAFPRLFVCYHRPAWGTGVKGDATDIRREWSPLFERYQVDAVFENDHHVYKRTHPIRGGKVDEEKGILYLGDGAWGVGTRLIPPDWKTKRPWLAEAKALNHLIRVSMTGDGFVYESKKADGEIFDGTKRPLRR